MKGKRWIAFFVVVLMGVLCSVLFTGCALQSDETLKLRDLDFTVLSEGKIPEELKAKTEELKSAPFQLTYRDKEYLYICVGYGQQGTGGYSIAVNELYLTEQNIHVNTSLLGPGTEEKVSKTPSYPYIVLKTELLEQTVVYE